MSRLSDWFSQEISRNASKTAVDIVRAQKDELLRIVLVELFCLDAV